MKSITMFRNVVMIVATVSSLAVVSCKKEAGVPDVVNADRLLLHLNRYKTILS